MDFLKKARSEVKNRTAELQKQAKQAQQQAQQFYKTSGLPTSSQHAPSGTPQPPVTGYHDVPPHQYQYSPPPTQQQYNNYQPQYPAAPQQYGQPPGQPQTQGYGQAPQPSYQQPPPPPPPTPQHSYYQGQSPSPVPSQQQGGYYPPPPQQAPPQSYYYQQPPSQAGQQPQYTTPPPPPLATHPSHSHPHQQAPAWNGAPHESHALNFSQPQSGLHGNHGRQGRQYPEYSEAACDAPETSLTDAIPFYIIPSDLLNRPGQSLISETVLPFCSKCFSTKIAPYPQLAASFKLLEKEPAPEGHEGPNVSYRELICVWRLPRVRQIFYEECVPQNSLDALCSFGRSTCEMSPCPGSQATGSPAAIYLAKDIDDYGMCPTCFEFYVAHTSCAHHFYRQEPRDDYFYVCDMGTRGFLFRALVEELDNLRPEFERFATEARAFKTFPPCPGGNNTFMNIPGEVLVFSANNGKSGNFCGACFHDHVQHTSMAKVFTGPNVLTDLQKIEISCDLGTPLSKLAMKIAAQKGDDEVWRRPVVLSGRFPKCPGLLGVDEEELQGVEQVVPWYQYRQHTRIQICPSCYVRTVELLGAASMFQPIDRPLRNGVVRLCYLTPTAEPNADVSDCLTFDNTLAWRGKMVRNTLSHGFVGKGNFVAFNYIADSFKNDAMPCGGNLRMYKAASGRTYRGKVANHSTDPQDFSFIICEDCWTICVKDKKLEGMLSQDMTPATRQWAEGYICNSYSMRTKRQLRNACEQGDWESFKQYWLKREQVRARYNTAKAQMQNQQAMWDAENQVDDDMSMQMASLNLMSQLNANTNATIMGIGSSTAMAAAGGGYSYSYTVPSAGYFGPSGSSKHYTAHNQPGATFESYQRTGVTGQDTANMRELFNRIESEWKNVE